MISNAKIRLCSVIGKDAEIIGRFIRHYKMLGVDEFNIILHNNNNEFYTSAIEALSKEGIVPCFVYNGRWDGQICTRLINEEISKYPDDWFLIADSDEFHLYPDGIEAAIKKAETYKVPCVTAVMLDRLEESGKLISLGSDSDDLWQRFPKVGFVNYPLSGAYPYKIVICKGSLTLSTGQHGIIISNKEWPYKGEVYAQTHHFKWVDDLEKQLRQRVRLFTDNINLIDKGDTVYIDECKKIIAYIEKNNGININDERFLISNSSNNFASYLKWDEVIKRTVNWAALQSSPKVEVGE